MFQKTVLIIATVVFLVMMIFIAIMLKKSLDNTKFPPEISSCPDYFDAVKENDSDGNKIISCHNTHRLGSFPEGQGGKVNFTDAKYKGNKGNYEKCLWAKSNGLTWDGLTNQLC